MYATDTTMIFSDTNLCRLMSKANNVFEKLSAWSTKNTLNINGK